MDTTPQDEKKFTFFLKTADMWEAVYADCKTATRSITFEQYILTYDALGKRFLDLFLAKAKEGLSVKLLLDRVGSRTVYGTPVIREIEAAGGEVQFYNGRSWLNVFVPWKWFPRNHTKVAVIDSDIVYVGSGCFEEIMAEWRDTQIRLEGILAHEVEAEFKHTWKHVKTGKSVRMRHFYATPVQNVWRYAASQPYLLYNPIYRELLKRIKKATNEIFLATPYFVPPWPLRRALKRAVKRGVKVKVMMGERTDIPLADCVSRSYFPRLLKYGVTVYLYQKLVLHTKYAIIDDWATIGSTNLDYLSLLHNREANIITTDAGVVSELRGHFLGDMVDCKCADVYDWTDRPLIYKAVGYVGRLIRRFL